MRNTNIYTVGYAPSEPPTNDLTAMYLREELFKISAVLNVLLDGQLPFTTVAPIKPRDGMVKLADGTNWNPTGAGQGVYCYYGAAWHLLG